MTEQKTGFKKTGATKQLGIVTVEQPAPQPAPQPKPDKNPEAK